MSSKYTDNNRILKLKLKTLNTLWQKLFIHSEHKYASEILSTKLIDFLICSWDFRFFVNKNPKINVTLKRSDEQDVTYYTI